MKKNVAKMVSLSLGLVMLVSGCSGSGQAPSSAPADTSTPKASNEPVTLIFFTAQNSVYADESGFENEIGQYIKKKFPNVTIQHIHKGKGQDYADLVAAGTIPDIVLESKSNILSRIKEFDLALDLSELIKKHNFDLNRIDDAALAQVRNANPEGQLWGLPFTLSNIVMFYNKDLFDKFGVPYPKDGMTWDEVYDIAKKMSRTVDGVDYKGLSAHPGVMMGYNQLSLNPLDLKENKAAINTEKWKQLIENFKRFYDIPSNAYTNIDDFPKGQTAIGVHVAEKVTSWYNANKDLNFDLASPPSFKELPNTGMQPNTYSLFVTKNSKYKDQAFQIVQHLLSEEVQSELSKQGIVTPLKSKPVRDLYGQSLPQLKGKNTGAVYYSKNAQPPAARANGLVDYNVNTAKIFDNIYKSSMDVNSAIRAVEEESNIAIQQLVNQKK
ncbi:ABC transporter substrate-binding protein [Paenibacillus sp. NPDC056579]|uniref:ABC transporter substrate-binding protein n=1 Tax=unclassified Paenibacillus TaxID=185978 RepID=UPI001EF9AF56|nr:extracellular solute-binding protein [Paenibacillus sp. H1-7]ULL16190.1 extracellular solute-binding protein [Paenibacillus sp. H1-7]